ncbi:Uncharacterized protein SCF082_LOCUS19438 [Durusdinium trenchii]|uniref:Uncharacterized protein n=1 Tax=Durusdinium trenchii TaxID=1381693 RepID=A0ABP0KVW5_9DINO
MKDEVRAKIAEFIQRAEEGGHVQGMNSLFSYLKSQNLMYEQRVIPALVHPHPSNRDGLGVLPSECHGLLSDIGDSGWSWKEVRAVACEVSDTESVMNFNQGLVERSKGLLPRAAPGSVKYASLSATHTNMVLRMFAAHHPHSDIRFTNNGSLSLEKLESHDGEYYDAVCHGLRWEIVAADVMEAFPALPSLVQLTMNTSGQLQRKETELQLCLRVFRVWTEQRASKDVVGFADVKKQLQRSKPEFVTSLPNIFSFVMQFCGGDEAPHAAIQGALCPEKIISHHDVKKLLTHEKIVYADEMIGEVRKLAKDKGLTDMSLIYEWGRSVLMILLEKKVPGVEVKQTLEDQAALLTWKVREDLGVNLTNRWDEHFSAPEESLSVKDTPENAGMRQYDESGKIANNQVLVEEMGFKVGCHIIRKDKVTATILGFKDRFVLLSVQGGDVSGECRVDFQSFLNKEWTLYKPKAQPEFLPEYWKHGPLDHPESQVAFIKAKIVVELRASMHKCTSVSNPSFLKVMSKPKGLFAEERMEKNALCLVPFTCGVMSKDHGSENANTSHVKAYTFQDLWDFYLTPAVSLPKEEQKGLIVPFWFVGTTYDPDMANCELFYPRGNSSKSFESMAVKIPYIRNTQALKAGDELLIFKEKTKKPLDLEQLLPNKRVRTKSKH